MNPTKDNKFLTHLYCSIENVGLNATRHVNQTEAMREANSVADEIVKMINEYEQKTCGHPPNKTYLNNGFWYCDKCGCKWESIK